MSTAQTPPRLSPSTTLTRDASSPLTCTWSIHCPMMPPSPLATLALCASRTHTRARTPSRCRTVTFCSTLGTSPSLDYPAKSRSLTTGSVWVWVCVCVWVWVYVYVRSLHLFLSSRGTTVGVLICHGDKLCWTSGTRSQSPLTFCSHTALLWVSWTGCPGRCNAWAAWSF
ncbi:hypothetical protein P4O66_014255 [Electrophorus voltai]|uniref:Uncharacterized protein n=1 Tax=Electrophorus voltai TaxID=2609070 RepID=A0AAD8Z2M8_9TELE|nr:hypothetical protein P4O66_014255 [Electrophorus voltai]